MGSNNYSYHSFLDLLNLINSRLKQIEVEDDKYKVEKKYNDEDFSGNIEIRYKETPIVTFHYFVSNLYKEGKRIVRGSFSLRAVRYPLWFQEYKEKGKNEIVHVDEFFKVSTGKGGFEDVSVYLDKYLPLGKEEDKDKICEEFKDLEVNKEHIKFDTRMKAYLIQFDLPSYLGISKRDEKDESKDDNITLCKYMSLETFRNMLNNRTFRMNSIAAMNDIYEGEWMNRLLYGEEETTNNKLQLSYVENSNILVTSLSNKPDDASMWRLYGNNGNGVCMMFTCPKDSVEQVYYADTTNDKFKQLREKAIKLKKDGITVHFAGADDMRYYIKSSSFNVEGEYRFLYEAAQETLLIANYGGLLSPYKDFDIKDDGSIDGLPLKIYLAYIGHNIPYYNTNLSILLSQCYTVFPFMPVLESEIKELR